MLFPLFDLNPHTRFPWCTVIFIVINLAVMGWLSQEGPQSTVNVLYNYGFIPQRVSQLDNGQPLVLQVGQRGPEGNVNPQAPKMRVVLPADALNVYLTLLTTMFLHGGWLHVGMNMWMLWIFGNNVEDRLGHGMFVLYYLLGGVLATFCHWAIDPQSTLPLVGASGAVAAVLGGYAITYPKAKVRTLIFFGMVLILDLPALVVLGAWFLLQMVAGLGMLPGGMQESIAFWAHIGGFVAGIVLMPLLALGASPAERDWRKEADEMFQFDKRQYKD